MTTTPEWYPAGPDARISLEIYQQESELRIEEAASPGAMGQLSYGVRFHEGDRNPGHDLAPEVVAVLRTDGRGPLHHGQRIEPDRLNAAADRVIE